MNLDSISTASLLVVPRVSFINISISLVVKPFFITPAATNDFMHSNRIDSVVLPSKTWRSSPPRFF